MIYIWFSYTNYNRGPREKTWMSKSLNTAGPPQLKKETPLRRYLTQDLCIFLYSDWRDCYIRISLNGNRHSETPSIRLATSHYQFWVQKNKRWWWLSPSLDGAHQSMDLPLKLLTLRRELRIIVAYSNPFCRGIGLDYWLIKVRSEISPRSCSRRNVAVPRYNSSRTRIWNGRKQNTQHGLIRVIRNFNFLFIVKL